MTKEEKEILFHSLSDLMDLHIKLCDKFGAIDSYEKNKYYETSSKLWMIGENNE